MSSEIDIPADRLTDAVDAILIGLNDIGPSARAAKPSEILGTIKQPSIWCDFTSHEIREAERFLFRCGLLPL
ncbi:MAG: hypothetical protein AAGK04_00965 [Planctomycetota bacterium]